jgi:Tol biopolymer transport system component
LTVRISVRSRWGIAALLVAVTTLLLVGCAYQPGGDALAFLRDGKLYTIQADGADLHQIAGDGIVSYSWSPTHQQLVYRTAKPFPSSRGQSPMENAADLSGDLSVVSVNGGSTIPITPDASALVRTDAWWNANGNRLLYAERFPAPEGLDDAADYIVSQADQPLGIASKSISDATALPALSADGAQVARINAPGNLILSATGMPGNIVTGAALRQLPNTSRVGRVLWRPHTDDLFYMTPAANDAVQLNLGQGFGAARALGTVAGLLDACFSPDGATLLVRTPEQFFVWDVNRPGGARYEWTNADLTAIPYWSPDSKRLLVFDATGATLVDLEKKTNTRVGAYAQPYHARQGAPHWRPAPGSPWSPDGGSIAFVADAGDSWSGARLTAAGLYVASMSAAGGANARLVDGGTDEAPLWSYLDPAASFLLPS